MTPILSLANTPSDHTILNRIGDLITDLRNKKPSFEEAKKALQLIPTYLSHLQYMEKGWNKSSSSSQIEADDWKTLDRTKEALRFQQIICNSIVKQHPKKRKPIRQARALQTMDCKTY